jgi:Outer membrane protein beta-barrel domain
MDPIRKIVLISLLSLFIGLASLPCRGQFFWLGFQAGEGVSWFSDPGQDSTKLSAGAGTSLAFFIRYGTRPYYQLGLEWLFSTNQMKFEVSPGLTAHDNVPFHNFKIPLTAGYEIIHKPRFKWRVGGGIFIGMNTILSSNSFNLKQEDIRNPVYGLIGETGIQYLNFLVLIDYNYSLNRFFAENASTYGVNVQSHLQIFALKVGMQF